MVGMKLLQSHKLLKKLTNSRTAFSQKKAFISKAFFRLMRLEIIERLNDLHHINGSFDLVDDVRQCLIGHR